MEVKNKAFKQKFGMAFNLYSKGETQQAMLAH